MVSAVPAVAIAFGRESVTERAHRLAPVLKALSDENRLAILLAVAERSSSVTELAERTGLSQPLVSHHLKALRHNGLVSVTAAGRRNVYALCCDALAQPIALLAGLADPACAPATGVR